MAGEDGVTSTPIYDYPDPFSVHRAEQLDDAVYKWFRKPTYFPELESARPCVLMGGRGTGKTTVLRCLSYEGRYELGAQTAAEWPYIGIYHRINSNRVTGFCGEELPQEVWTKAFAHYVNLLLCNKVFEFLIWYRSNIDITVELGEEGCTEVSETLYLNPFKTQHELAAAVKSSLQSFERFLNSLNLSEMPPLTLQGQPLDELCKHVSLIAGLSGRKVSFIVDEFENLLDYQQVVFNTLIKHGEAYTFKIGVRELGWRQRYTANKTEALVSPADYVLIDIGEKLKDEDFAEFALEVCRTRLEQIPRELGPLDMPDALPGLTPTEEAKLLGVEELANEILQKASRSERRALDTLDPLEIYFIDFWARASDSGIGEVLEARASDPASWNTRFDNYKIAVLFEIRKGKSGIRKYYSGWNVYLKLAYGNIRYLLELISTARQIHRSSGGQENTPISVVDQTEAAKSIGKKHLFELEGLSVEGAKLTKLLLGLGRVFEIMAKDPAGHAPEVTTFYLQEDASVKAVEGLLTQAIMHLALTRETSNKLAGPDLKGYDYGIHPVFSPFFEFSYRRKRRMKLSPYQLVELISEPRKAIQQILRQSHRSAAQPLPEQLRLFHSYYGEPY